MTPEASKRVLVVDDDEGVRVLLATMLRQRGLHVDEAAGGREAIELLDGSRYVVILLDLLMPDTSGFDVLKHIETDLLQAPPIVLVLTGADRRVIDQIDSQRVHGIVRKPCDVEELVALVAACSEIRGRGFGAMAIATFVSGAPLLAWLNRFSS